MGKKHSHDNWDNGWEPVQRCYSTHPALPVGDFKIYGGSCSSPVVKDADIYVGFDSSMTRTSRQFPWEPGTEFLYKITDMAAPADADSFILLLDYLAVQLTAGAKIHLGCIGGHGRTGTVLAALVKVVTGEADAITYVRKNYCERAVESDAQVRFLNKHFGITEVPGYKSHSAVTSSGFHSGGSWGRSKYPDTYPFPKSKSLPKASPVSPMRIKSGETFAVTPARNDKVTLWGSNVVFDKLPEPDIITL